VRLFAGDQADPMVLDRAAAEVAPRGFDIIIDDCAHIGPLAKASRLGGRPHWTHFGSLARRVGAESQIC
jgi:hypothetical protein